MLGLLTSPIAIFGMLESRCPPEAVAQKRSFVMATTPCGGQSFCTTRLVGGPVEKWNVPVWMVRNGNVLNDVSMSGMLRPLASARVGFRLHAFRPTTTF